MSTQDLKTKLKEFWSRNERKTVLVIGFILVAVIAFEVGILKGQNWQQKPLVIEKVPENQVLGAESLAQQCAPEAQKLASEGSQSPGSTSDTPQDCSLLGSKNSDKYHLPTCQWAKRIKPENVVCFKDLEDAKSKGYEPCGTCNK